MFRQHQLLTGGCFMCCLAFAGCRAPAAPTSGAAGRNAAQSVRLPPERAAIGSQHPPDALRVTSARTANQANKTVSTSAQLTSLTQPIQSNEAFLGQRELKLPELIGEVLARNQTLAAMRAASLAVAEQYPQARALDDPLLMSMIAPASLNSGIAGIPGNSAGYLVGGAQKLPWFGKRQLRGDAALAEGRAARWDVEDARLTIIETTALAYYDYFLVEQQLALNVQNTAKLQEFHDIAVRKYESNLVQQQDVLQAEVELAELARRQIELERMGRIAVARINTLMHRPPDAYVPRPPSFLSILPVPLSAAELRAIAVSRRPDLAALSAKVQAEQARLKLAEKEFLPDVEVFGRYDNFWSQASLRGQVGMNMNVPLYRDKRHAAVREAQYRLSQRRAEFQQRIDDINREVQTSYEQFDESQRTVTVYREQILPAARKNVGSAFAAYEAGRGDFLRLVAAQRQLIGLQERYQESIANYHRRRVELERVVGRSFAGPWPLEAIPPGSR